MLFLSLNMQPTIFKTARLVKLEVHFSFHTLLVIGRHSITTSSTSRRGMTASVYVPKYDNTNYS